MRGERIGERLAGKRYWREGDARRALAAAEASGLSEAAFARKTGVRVTRLRWWRKRLGAESAGRCARGPSPMRFLRVRVAQPPAAAVPFELALGAGRVLRIATDFDDAALARIVRALVEAGC